MNNFKRGGFRRGSGNFGGRSKFGSSTRDGRHGGDRSGRPAELFPAVCAECRKKCEVPFRPTGDKPVYCRDCFDRQRHVPGRNSNGADGPRVDLRRGVALEHGHKSDYARPRNDEGNDALKRQLDSLESKMDRILEFVNKNTKAPVSVTPILRVASRVARVKKAKIPARKAATKEKK